MHSNPERARAEGARWRAINLAALRLFLRLAPSERQRVFVLTIVIGALCGLAAVAFHLAIQAAEGALIERAMAAPGTSWMLWTILVPTLGGLVSGVLLYYVVPDARGSGIPQVKVAYVVKGGRMPIRVAIGKFVIGVIQIGSGASLGREGPTVQICAGIASSLGQLAALSRQNLRRLLPVGAAAGIAAAFNAPIAAVTFTIEEVVGDLDQTVLTGVVVAAALAAAIERIVLGEHPVFTIPAGYGLHHIESLLLYALLGVAGAFVALLFTESLIALRARFQRLAVLPAWARPAVGGCVTGLLAVAALWWLKTDGVTGGGYDTLSQALGGQLAVHVMLALCLMKLAATVFSYSSGGAGGIFAPALFIGGMLGGAFGYVDVALFHHDRERDRRVRAGGHGRGVRRDHPRADHLGADHLRDDRRLRPDPAADDRQYDRLRPGAAHPPDADLRGAAGAGWRAAAASPGAGAACAGADPGRRSDDAHTHRAAGHADGGAGAGAQRR